MKMFAIPVMCCFVVLAPSFLLADELDLIPTEEAQKWGARLSQAAAKVENPQITIEADAIKANGVHVPDLLGMIVVPQKDLKESEELAKKFKNESGAALGFLFAYHLLPIIDGSPVDAKRLRTVKVNDDDSTEHKVYAHLLAVRQLAEDNYRLYLYGSDEKPLLDVKFSEGTGPGPEPVAIEIKDADERTRQGTAVVTVFGKYQASFRIGYEDE